LTQETAIELSICIPTLNRGRFIGETLESIVSQATDEVEIVVVDGGSTDNTSEVVAGFKQKFPSIRYFREEPERNAKGTAASCAGFDRDCNRAVELARGKYCWLFTDDDLLKPGAVKAVLGAGRSQYGVIIVNAEVRSEEFAELLEPQRLHLTSNRVYTSAESERFFKDVGGYVSFVGAVVIERDLWLARDKEPYFGTGLIHIGVLFQKPFKEPALVLAEALISIRYGNALYARSSRYFQIQMFLWPKLVWSFKDFSEAAKSEVCRREPWRRFRALLFYRAIGAFSVAEYRTWLRDNLGSGRERIAARVAASFPGRVANLVAFVYYHLSGRLPGQFLLDLVKSPHYFARPFTATKIGNASPSNVA
jgi:abequosyltransferase